MKENNDYKILLQLYLQNPPDGMTKKDVQAMSENDLLDMHYFLNEDLDEIFDLSDEE